MLELSAIAIDMLASTIAVRSRATGAYVEGRWQGGAPETSDIAIAEQPVGGDELQQVPEGERTEEMRMVWTRSDLRTASADGELPADTLIFGGKTWKVITVFQRAEAGFTKAVVGRIDG